MGSKIMGQQKKEYSAYINMCIWNNLPPPIPPDSEVPIANIF